ncbi:hypothetical protein FOXG_18204 [Fusarium oxysporum f. sp. lycopersici 4287]|uniref:Uncharacterized protein n=1 Tax=Fusarium oxysporum f. sp. lycopersici (strain 4287 / CBS 123668 / FGSC 9935 / NRRL 34936) TaxID=426428 RepID=A0A0J9UCV9_FUSO4|nr:hypothetical protein FOXG_18204 [Fusarium oxysporum f. sp. lycopersici 4287]KNA96899.1 hypothetical protein FOXG_18204 [Fusarium oxysporum f. sp. lycopersici 4287]
MEERYNFVIEVHNCQGSQKPVNAEPFSNLTSNKICNVSRTN